MLPATSKMIRGPNQVSSRPLLNEREHDYSNRVKTHINNGTVVLNFAGENKLQELIDNEKSIVLAHTYIGNALLTGLLTGFISFEAFPVDNYDSPVLSIGCAVASVTSFLVCEHFSDNISTMKKKNEEKYNLICEMYSVESAENASSNCAHLLKDAIRKGRKK